MKPILSTLLILLLSLINTKAEDKPLRYNFQVGDKFGASLNYQWEISKYPKSTTINNFSLKYPTLFFRFKVMAKEDSITTIKATLIRFIRNTNNYTYDSQDGFPPIFESDQAWSLFLKKPSLFKIDNFGEISDVYFNTNDTPISNYKDFSRNKILDKNMVRIGNHHIRFDHLLQLVFPTTYSIEEFSRKYKKRLPFANKLCNILPIKGTNKVIYLPYTIKLEALKDSTNLSYINKYSIDLSKAIDTLTFDYNKGRITEGHIGYWEKHHDYSYYYNKRFDVEFKTTIPDTSRKSDFNISGLLTNYKNSELKIYLWNKYPDSELIDIGKIPVNKNGEIEKVFNLNRPYELVLKVTKPDGPSISKFIFVEPGDSIYLNIDTNTSEENWTIQCKNNDKFEFTGKINTLTLSINDLKKIQSPEALIKAIKSNTHSLIQLIEKQNLSDYYKRNLTAHVYAENIYTGFKYIKNSVKNKQVWEGKLWESIEINNFACYTSIRMRELIYSYFRYNSKQQYKISTGMHAGTESEFYYAEAIFDGESEYFMLSYLVNEAIRQGNINKAVILSEKFNNLYPNTEIADYFSSITGDISRFIIHNTIPFFEVKQLNGESYSSENIKGKWCYFAFINTNDDIDWLQIKSLGKIHANINDSRFNTLLILTDPDLSETTLDSLKRYYKGTVLLNPDWKYKSTQIYNATSRYSGFLVNPYQQFEAIWYSLPTKPLTSHSKKKYYTKEIDALKEYMNLWEEKNNYSSFDWRTFYWIISSTLVLLMLIIMTFLYRQKRIKKLANERKERLQLELKSIRSQLNPHFIFNSMNSIQHLVADGKNKDASKYLSEFSSLMRQVLMNAEKQLIPLEEELSAIKKYLELETLRFGFNYKLKISDELDIFNIEVPSLFLQPFVENAVIHGISGLMDQGSIIITLNKQGQHLVCQIEDNGAGYQANNENSNGHGISLSRKRFAMIKDSIHVNIDLNITNKSSLNPNENGTLVELTYELESE